MSEALLKLENVSKIFTLGIIGRVRITAVNDVSMEIRRGEVLGILGESGSGKSTIAKLILKILKPSAGKIFYAGKDIWEIDTREYYKRVQGVFQDPYASFNPRRKVLDVLLDIIRNYYPEEIHNQMERVTEVLNSVGMNIKDIAGKYPHEFSGGQLQRISIARALLVKPDIIIADEPVSMVDASTRIDILNIFLNLRDRENLTSIIIGHDLSLTQYVSDRVAILYRGQIVEQGPADMLRDPAHPYTKMLLEAVPRMEFRWSQFKYSVESVERGNGGDVGCVFASRCPSKMSICSYLQPPIFNVGYSQVKCWLYGPK